MLHHYDYKPLNANQSEIRLINLHPSKQFSSQIRCTIFTTSVHTAPKYQALSYCWGETSNPISIKLDDIPASGVQSYLPVTSNLYQALRRIRSKGWDKPLWVDAICINQGDKAERSHQVTLMRNIYEGAESTIVWLGDFRISPPTEPAENSGLAIGLIKAWEHAYEDIDAFLDSCPIAFKKQMWKGVEKLVNRPWWKRMWIYQEFIVSKAIYFLCGTNLLSNMDFRNARMSWRLFEEQAAKTRQNLDKLGMIFSANIGRVSALDYQRVLIDLRRQRERLHDIPDDIPRMDLLELLRCTSGADASDARDKLYALLGVDEVQDVTVLPNYHDTASKVYTDFAVSYIQSKPNLAILSDAGIGYGIVDPQLPSWVPELRITVMQGQDLIDKANRASGDRNRTAHLNSTHSLLTTTGFVCTTVTDFVTSGADWAEMFKTWAQFALRSHQAHPTGISKVQAFFRTTIADMTGFGAGRPDFRDATERRKFFELARGFMSNSGRIASFKDPQLKHQFHRWLATKEIEGNSDYALWFTCFLELIPDDGVPRTDKELIRPFLTSEGQYGHLEWPTDDEVSTKLDSMVLEDKYARYAMTPMRRKCFFATEAGYIGIGPSMIQAEDKICVIFGCPVPLLLRPAGNTYRLVGGVYVYGMMQGEMITELEAGKFDLEDFVIS